MFKESQHRTVILITHRLGSARHADRIIVLDGGEFTEEGTHDTLIELDGCYAAMWRAQADTYASSPTRADPRRTAGRERQGDVGSEMGSGSCAVIARSLGTHW
jgi:ABC-type multidrug transport system ATPase subunit